MQSYNELYDKVNTYIESIDYPSQPEGLYAPIKYVLSLGGKRIRPVLMLMAYNLYRNDVDTIMPQAIGLETYHNFTLLHDDLMDKADMRRGNPTVHKRWNDNTAILSGDAMLICAYRLFTDKRGNNDDNAQNGLTQNLLAALQTFNDATLGVCDGQQYDIEFETRNDVSESEYMEMIRLKTSLLLACALKIGAQLAGASAEEANLLYDFGEKMGLAFQLQDDLLDVYGDPSVFGKKIGGDILCNKKTFMLIKALELSDTETHNTLQEWIDRTNYTPNEKIAAVTAIYDKVGIRQICESKIEALFADALRSLDRVKVDEAKKQPLREFAHNLLKRNK